MNTLTALDQNTLEVSSVTVTIHISALEKLTGFESFTVERKCITCTSSICPGKQLIQFGMVRNNNYIDEYPCFVKAYLLSSLSVNEVQRLLLESRLLRYVGVKTQAVSRTTTRRGAYGNLGTLLVILLDYLKNCNNYSEYSGMKFSDYLAEVRNFPGCAKIQNHAINHRLNQEFRKLFERTEQVPIIRVPIPGKLGTTYKINENLLNIQNERLEKRDFASLLSTILQLYFHLRETGSKDIIERCRELEASPLENEESIIQFFKQKLRHNDARIFEVTAFVVFKAWYSTKKILIGENPKKLREVTLTLHRTGRAHANDGGIDYVLTPLGKYFQATQNFNFSKYFLDIDKLGKFPISFAIQTEMTAEEAIERIRRDARAKYSDRRILDSYLSSFDEVFTLGNLDEILAELGSLPEGIKNSLFKEMLEEFVRQYSVEYNIE